MGKERRAHPRVSVKIWAEEKLGKDFFFHLVTNMSRGGLFLQKKIPFPTGSKVDLELSLSEPGDKICLKGRIVDNYRDPELNIIGAGVQFIDIDEETEKKLEQVLLKLKAPSSP
jgi:Tfp pilus assembly protein PilZ